MTTLSHDPGANLGDDSNTNKPTSQVSDDSQSKPAAQDIWKGNSDYFQSGGKAGTLKPRARAKADGKLSQELSGLDIEALHKTEKETTGQVVIETVDVKAEKAKKKAEKKSADARIGSKMAMRILDRIVMFVSGGEFGKDFTPDQHKARNAYHDELENDWREYLLTLDIPLHPGLIVAFGSLDYTLEAFKTERGKERVKTWKEKMFGKVGAALLSGKK